MKKECQDVGNGLEMGQEVGWLRNNKDTILTKSQDCHRGVLRKHLEIKIGIRLRRNLRVVLKS